MPDSSRRLHAAPTLHRPRSGDGGRAGKARRVRWDTDAGITARDVAALRWLGQQYAARSDVLRVLLGRLSPGSTRIAGQVGEETLRQILDRWEDRGLVVRDRLLGFQWVVPTGKALGLVGLDVRPWSFVIPQLAHVHAVGIVRLALEPGIPDGGQWLSERELRHDSSKQVPDGAIELPDDPDAPTRRGQLGEEVDPLPRRIAVEVELTRKTIARLRQAWERPRAGYWLRSDYYAPPEVAGYLTGQLARIRPDERERRRERHPIHIYPLPQVGGTAYMQSRRSGLRGTGFGGAS